MCVHYNDNDPQICAWLRELMADGLIPKGAVDERDIREICGAELKGFRQVHLFAGIGGWPYALRLAGWPDHEAVWTGSCPAKPSAPLGSAKAKPTKGIFGPLFGASSPSADLQRSLESRLRAALGVNGSPEYALTWKRWDMPWGPPICRLRASARRTSGKGFSGWPTTTANDATGSQYAYSKGDHNKRVLKLPGAATLAGWPTPNIPNRGCESRESKDKRGAGGIDLQTTAKLAGWPTPSARDWRDGRSNQHETNARPLNEVAQLGAWPNGPKLYGLISTSLGAEAQWVALPDHAALSPAHSLCQNGYPAAWLSCGVRAMRSCPRLRRSSLRRTSPQREAD